MKNYNIKFKVGQLKNFITASISYLVIGLLPLFHSAPVFAAKDLGPIEPIPGAYNPDLSNPDKGAAVAAPITTIFSNALAIFTLAAGIMFLIYFILAALAWITSSGKPDKVQEAQNRMINAVIGLIAVVATYSIAFIVGKILGVDFLDPGKYIQNFWKGTDVRTTGPR